MLSSVRDVFPPYLVPLYLSEYDIYTGTSNVTLAKHRLQLPDDGLCKPKHVAATFIIVNVLIII